MRCLWVEEVLGIDEVGVVLAHHAKHGGTDVNLRTACGHLLWSRDGTTEYDERQFVAPSLRVVYVLWISSEVVRYDDYQRVLPAGQFLQTFDELAQTLVCV